MIRTLLFINRFLQVWYQNEEDIHVLHICENWTFISGQERFFFAECIWSCAKLYVVNMWPGMVPKHSLIWHVLKHLFNQYHSYTLQIYLCVWIFLNLLQYQDPTKCNSNFWNEVAWNPVMILDGQLDIRELWHYLKDRLIEAYGEVIDITLQLCIVIGEPYTTLYNFLSMIYFNEMYWIWAYDCRHIQEYSKSLSYLQMLAIHQCQCCSIH